VEPEPGGVPGAAGGVPPERLAALEALLFASDAPLPLERIAEVLETPAGEARAAVDALRAACESPDRGLSVVEVGGGVRLVTRSEHAPVLLRLQRLRLRSRLSRAAVETLAIVAYRQPISRPEIEQLRGVGTESVLTHLLERRLLRVVGRKDAPGRPVLYGTTREFLEHFGLNELGELPPFEAPPGDAAGSADGSRSAAPPGEAGPPDARDAAGGAGSAESVAGPGGEAGDVGDAPDAAAGSAEAPAAGEEREPGPPA
jgi:segregation and condensation protein B